MPRPATASRPDLDTVQISGRESPDHLPDPEELPLRILHIAALRGLGYSLRSIGQCYGVTPQAIALMLMRHKAALQAGRSRTGLGGLSPRAVNVLGLLRIKNRAEARGVTDWESRLRGVRNCGRKTVAEIRQWAAGGFSIVELPALIAILSVVAALALPSMGVVGRIPFAGKSALNFAGGASVFSRTILPAR